MLWFLVFLPSSLLLFPLFSSWKLHFPNKVSSNSMSPSHVLASKFYQSCRFQQGWKVISWDTGNSVAMSLKTQWHSCSPATIKLTIVPEWGWGLLCPSSFHGVDGSNLVQVLLQLRWAHELNSHVMSRRHHLLHFFLFYASHVLCWPLYWNVLEPWRGNVDVPFMASPPTHHYLFSILWSVMDFQFSHHMLQEDTS